MYEIITDSSSNLTDEIISQYGIKIISFTYRIGNDEYKSYADGKCSDVKSFYERMRADQPAGTAQLARQDVIESFESILEEGKDLLYISFSSGLTGSMNVVKLIADELEEKYKDRKIYVVDSLAASMGEGLIVYHAALLKQEGKSIDEVKDWVEDNKLKLCHWFTVDDLKYLKRGGRVSPTTAFVGTLMGIKPILHVDDEGHLIPVGKIRGRLHSVEELFNRTKETIVNPKDQVIFIGHGDCIDDAKYLEERCRKELHVKDVVINYIDAVIGAHSGPGTLAIFYLGTKR